MRGKGFKQQDSCLNCVHCLFINEYDEGHDLYCNIDKSERPPSGSVFEGESFYHDRNDCENDYAGVRLLQKKWDEWAKPRAVNESSICAEWVK